MSPGRIHRLPQRLDYTLIPAPLDLDLTVPLTPEKSPFPTVIVTPAEPARPTDFAFAFIAPRPKVTLRERAVEFFYTLKLKQNTVSHVVLPKPPAFTLRARTSLLVFLFLFIMACHLFTDRFAVHRPHLRFMSDNGVATVDGEAHSGFFGLGAILSAARMEPKRDSVVTEPVTNSRSSDTSSL